MKKKNHLKHPGEDLSQNNKQTKKAEFFFHPWVDEPKRKLIPLLLVLFFSLQSPTQSVKKKPAHTWKRDSKCSDYDAFGKSDWCVHILLWNHFVLSRSAVSDSLQLHGLQPARLLCPGNSPGKNTGVGCHAFFQGSSQPKDRIQASHIASEFFTV